MPHLPRRGCFVLCVLTLCAPGCNSSQEDICENVVNCAQGGESDAILRCEDEANLLQGEARDANCADLFDAYYACADSNFVCSGATPSFPGCEAKRTALESCLTKSRSRTACGRLETRTNGCGSSTGDTGAGTSTTMDGGATLSPACTLARDCQARCYLDNVANACAPAIDELSRVTACSQRCPP